MIQILMWILLVWMLQAVKYWNYPFYFCRELMICFGLNCMIAVVHYDIRSLVINMPIVILKSLRLMFKFRDVFLVKRSNHYLIY